MIVVMEAERPELAKRGDTLSLEVWPEYNRNGDVMNDNWRFLDRAGPSELEGALSADADRALCELAARRRARVRPLDPRPRANRRRDPQARA
jgi:hypothetical protein